VIRRRRGFEVTQGPPQIFISYARDDDDALPGPEELSGFVTYLYTCLLHQLKQLGQRRPRLFLDRHNIEGADQFAEIIEAEVNRSDYLLVILSENWLGRPWCLKELETFCKRWGDQARSRIIVVNKSWVDRAHWTEALRGQTGYDFFEIERGGERAGRERPFFSFGKTRDERYNTRVYDIARWLWLKVQAPVDESATATGQPSPPPGPTPRPNGRIIYLAQPADDMKSGYDRVAAELRGRGFMVVPNAEIPYDRSAVSFVDEAMGLAEASVHLLGEFKGYAPAEEEPIAKLQLSRARLKPVAGSSSFKRIVWVPKVLRDEDGHSLTQRHSLELFGRFDQQLDGDKIFGGELSDFVEFLTRDLEIHAPRQPAPEVQTGIRQKILILHNARDTDSAVDFGRALQRAFMTPSFCLSQGTATQIGAYNQRRFRECDQAVVYWANAKEGWALAQATVLSEWKSPEPKRRGLVAAAPGTDQKRLRVAFPPDEVDFVVDLTKTNDIGPEHLSPLAVVNVASAPAAESSLGQVLLGC
jgi:hypothetical protein